MKSKNLLGLLSGMFLASMMFVSFPTEAGPGDGKGKQYWECRGRISCDNSHEYRCSTGGDKCKIIAEAN